MLPAARMKAVLETAGGDADIHRGQPSFHPLVL